MEDENEPTTPETPAADPAPVETPPAEGAPTETNKLEDLPEWAQKDIKSLRAEAANYRTKFREADTKLQNAKTPEEFEAARAELTAQLDAAQADATRARLAHAHELPDDLAAMLTGTPEEMEAKAKTLAKHTVAAAAPPVNLSGGLSPENGGDEDDGLTPRELARKYRRNR